MIIEGTTKDEKGNETQKILSASVFKDASKQRTGMTGIDKNRKLKKCKSKWKYKV